MKHYLFAFWLAVILNSPFALAEGSASPGAQTVPAANPQSATRAAQRSSIAATQSSVRNPQSSLVLEVQRRSAAGAAAREKVTLDPTRTAVVVVDMWDRHWCVTYTARVAGLVPRMNRTLEACRKLGMQVVFAPSDVAGFYKDAPQRKAMQAVAVVAQAGTSAAPGKGATTTTAPATGAAPTRAAADEKPSVAFNPPGPPGGRDFCECGPDRPCKGGGVWKRQNPDLKILDADLIADCNNHRELVALCRRRQIDTLVYMGVASNMCVLYRDCGMINMRRFGLRELIVGDLTEAITANGFNPDTRMADPNFTPAGGSARVLRYIEQTIAPSIQSRQLLASAGMGAAAGDTRPSVVFVIADDEYKSERTLPAFAKELQKDYRCTFVVADAKSRNDFPGLEALYDADLLVLSVRRRSPSVPQMDILEKYIRAGRPIVALRVSIVPFQVAPKDRPLGHVSWERFDLEVLGCNYRGYDPQARKTGCEVWAEEKAKDHPILAGVQADGEPVRFHSPSWNYKLSPLAAGTTVLLWAQWSKDAPIEPAAWTYSHQGGRVFYTCLGHEGDFAIPQFRRLLRNAIDWAVGG